ncbi:MAG: hypothetical protein Q4B40_01070 [Clostridia bacterium]|nr:hypothetical protein [Clostridia bacterium]
MKLNSSFKKILCFLLAVLMVVATVGCAGETAQKKKKKKIIKKKVIVVANNDNVVFENLTLDSTDDTATESRPERPLPDVATNKDKYVEPVVPEFSSEYVDLNLTNDYVIVYSLENWNGRYEGKNGGSNGTPISVSKTANNYVTANDLKVFFKDKYKLNLSVVEDTDPIATSATKKIILSVSSSLKENEFLVRVDGDDLIFEGGHFAMVEKAAKWFQTVEVKTGKVATLKSKNNDFKSTVTLDNVKYDYVWGDEHDGSGVLNKDKWVQIGHGISSSHEIHDLANVFDDERFNALENGRMRLTADRYYDESDSVVGYAISGNTNTSDAMLFRNGYVEFRARLPYNRGAFPAIWSLSTESTLSKSVPNYAVDDGYGVYKNRVWNIEIDLFESFADTEFMTTTIHKWYQNIEDYDPKTNVGKVILDFGNGERVDIYDKLKTVEGTLGSSMYTCAYSTAYDYNWRHYFENLETLNNEYHVYAYLYESDHISFFIDGEKFLDFDWDVAYDYKNNIDVSRNNNGVGYNFWHYLIYDMNVYTPGRYGNSSFPGPDSIVTNDDLPLNMYVDYVRIYQDLDDTSMSLYYPAAQE